MCGIAGLLNGGGQPADARVIAAMGAALRHRGPDGEGLHLDGPMGLAHRRLAILDLSDAGRQPMANEDGTIWLTFNGEIYNFADVRAELVRLGHRFRSNTDSEVILHAYEEWDVAALSRLNGMFAFGLWDARRRRLWLVRDRLGVKPLFYARLADGTVVFGSEIKAVLADPRVERQVDPEALTTFLAFNYVPAPQTLLRTVRQLEPGHYLLIEADGRTTDVAYWDLAFDETPPPRPDDDWRDELTSLLSDAVRLRLVSDVPFGAFLSGGVDSSGVSYWMARHLQEPLKTFTVGFKDRAFDELPYAREVARLLNADHHERIVEDDGATLLPSIVSHAEEPTADSSMIAVYHLAALAREHVTMVLSGDGADDILAGYETYQAYYVQRLYRRLPALLRRGVIAPLVAALPVSYRKIGWDMKLRRFVAAADLPWEDAHASWRIIFEPDARRRVIAGAIRSRVDGFDPLDRYRGAFARTNARDPLNRMLYVDTRVYLPSDMLVKIDRMTMAHGLEAREPYLDYRLVEFSARVPPRLKLRGWHDKKHLLKASLRGRLPDGILDRKKAGFNVPKARWMRQGLRPFVHDTLARPRVCATGLLDAQAVQTLLDEHDAGRADHSHQIWGLLVLVLWHEQFVAGRAS